MKQELDNLTTEESMANSPEIFSPTFKSNLTRFSITQSRREELLRFALQEAEQNLQHLESTRRMIKGTLKEKSNILSHKISKNREDILRLEKQLEKLEINSANIANAIKKQNQQKLEAFKVALKPLQDVMEMLQTSKKGLSEDLFEIEESLRAFSEKENEFISNLDEKYSEDKKVEDEKKSIISTLEDMKKVHQWEYKEFVQDKETKELLARTREDKKIKLAQLNSMDKVILDLTNQSEILSRDIELLKSSCFSSESLVKNNTELCQLENFLNMQCMNFSGPLISETIEDLCTMGNFPVNQMIFKEQFKLIERLELEMLENAKNQQEVYETQIEELNRIIEEQEVEVYALISVQQNDVNLEKQLKSMKKKLEQTKNDAKKFAVENSIKVQTISKWKSENRNILLITDTERIPTDEQVVEEFQFRLQPYISNPEHWQAMESVINRYCEKAKDRESMQVSLLCQKEQEESLIEKKTETLKQVRAIKTSKDSERALLHNEFQKNLNAEKVILKELENSKLEVESAKKLMFKDRLNQSLQNNKDYAKVQKMYGEKAVKKLVEKETLILKTVLEQEKNQLKETFERLYKEKQAQEKSQSELKKEISSNYLLKLNEIQGEIKRLKGQKAKIDKEMQILTDAENEAHSKLDSLADQKRNELVKEAKRVACSHGGGRTEQIDRLYSLRTKKESEIVEFESELIKLECGLTDKETQIELELVKLKARITNLRTEIEEIDKAQKQAQKLEKTISKIDITTSEFASDIDMASDGPKKSVIKDNLNGSEKVFAQSPFEVNINTNITEEVKDAEEESEFQPPRPCSKLGFEVSDDNFSVVSSEIPCPPESKFTFDRSEAKYKNFFEAVIPLLEGGVIYKLYKAKKNIPFDPLESKVYSPEQCGYSIRKVKLNKQLSKIEIRQVGKNGVESSIMIDSILSIVVPGMTNDLIRARSKNLNDEDCTLEKSDEYNKVYRDQKAMGNVDSNSTAFVYKAKENCFFPFIVSLKSGRVELMAEGLHFFKMWVTGINTLLKNRTELERLKYKISEIKQS